MRVAGIGCVVTGASDGIGRALAIELGRRGCRVALIARRHAALAAVAAEVVAAGGTACVAPADVSDPEALASAVGQASAQCGPLRLAVVNAGVGIHGACTELSAGRIREAMEVNYLGAMGTARAALPALRRAAPSALVAVSSLAALIPYRGGGSYGASKAALNAALASLRLELDGSGVSVGWLCPGQVDTAMIVTGVPHAKLPRLSRLTVPILPVSRVVRAVIRLAESGGGQRVIPWQAAFYAAFARHLPRLAERIELLTGAGET